MAATARRDIDHEFADWLQALKDSRLPAAQLNELYQAREAARAVKDKRPPLGDETSERINAALTAMGL